MSWYSFIPKLFNMSLTASVVICIVLVLRLILKKMPKVVSYALWSVVLFRLLCPISIESDFSFFNLLDTPTKDSGIVSSVIEYIPENIVHTEYPSVTMPIPGISNVINEALPQGQEQLVADPLEAPTSFATYIWMIGILVMVIYSIVSYIRLHQTLLSSVKLHDNIFLADSISSPFVMGLIQPKIYLPSSLSEKERDYIILHEQHHIRRGDHVVKLLSFAALCVHWFNPLVWIAFVYSSKDMEMSCDEAVLRKLGEDIRVDYSASLISLATGRRIIAGSPLAFGEGDTEGRVKNIAKWKKPAVWVIVIAVIVCVVLAVCLITNPMNKDTMLLGAEYRIAETLYNTSITSYVDNDSPSYCITADYCLWERHGDDPGKWRMIGQLEPYALTEKELKQYTASSDSWRRNYRIGEITDAYILRENGDEASMFFLAFTTQKGDTLLGYGIEDVSERGQGVSDDTSLYWLCRLESTFHSKGRIGMYFDRSLAASVGGDADIFYTWTNAYIPGYIIVGFEWDESPYTDAIVVTPDDSDEKSDFGFAVFSHNEDESGYRLLQCYTYKDNGLAQGEIFICPDLAVMDVKKGFSTKKNYARVEFKRHLVDGTAKGFGVRVIVLEEDELAAETNRSEVNMIPTTANITGAFDGYLYFPIDGANYRYEIIFDDPASVTPGKLMYQFTEEADPSDVEWRVYAVDDYPDRSVVLAEAGDDYVHLYRYSPSKAVDPALLEQAKEDGKIVLENGYATSGQALWNTFYKYAEQGKHISADIVHYHTLREPGQYDQKYYEAHKEDYPALYEFELTHDSGIYTMKWNENGTEYVRTYKYLRVFEDTLPTTQSSKAPQKVTRYVLTNDGTATLDELWRGVASSQLGDYIDFYTIYSVKN